MTRNMFAAMAAAVIWVGALEAQTTTLDEGSFRISINGKEVGTETFSIRQDRKSTRLNSSHRT